MTTPRYTVQLPDGSTTQVDRYGPALRPERVQAIFRWFHGERIDAYCLNEIDNALLWPGLEGAISRCAELNDECSTAQEAGLVFFVPLGDVWTRVKKIAPA